MKDKLSTTADNYRQNYDNEIFTKTSTILYHSSTIQMKQYAVCHVSKGKGQSKGLTEHNERGKTPKNADPEKTKLNKIDNYNHLGTTLEDRADEVIKRKGVKRKVQKDAVKYCPILLSGSHEQMELITKAGKLDEWMEDNRKFVEERFGKDKIISFAMHADEKTPHIHVSVVPIMEDGRKKEGVRLSAKDMFNPGALKKLQSQYAEAMQKWGFERGEDAQATRAKHQDTNQYYKQLPELLEEKRKEVVQAQEVVKSIETAIEKYGFKMPEKGLRGIFTQSKTEKANFEALLAQIGDLTHQLRLSNDHNKQQESDYRRLIDQIKTKNTEISDLKKDLKRYSERFDNQETKMIELFNKVMTQQGVDIRLRAIHEDNKRTFEVMTKSQFEQKQAHKNTPGLNEPDQEQGKGMSL